MPTSVSLSTHCHVCSLYTNYVCLTHFPRPSTSAWNCTDSMKVNLYALYTLTPAASASHSLHIPVPRTQWVWPITGLDVVANTIIPPRNRIPAVDLEASHFTDDMRPSLFSKHLYLPSCFSAGPGEQWRCCLRELPHSRGAQTTLTVCVWLSYKGMIMSLESV
jgi:hypothetical protein